MKGEKPEKEAETTVMFENSEVTKMLERRRVLHEVEEAFEIQTEEYKRNIDKLKMQEETIKKTDNKIQEKFIKHCKFLAENKDKRARAKRHLEEEKKIKEEKLQEIAVEEETLVQLNIQKEFLEKKINQMSCYEDFLKKVVENNQDQYTDIKDLVQRFQILQQSNKKFREQKAEVEKQLNDLTQQKLALEKSQNHEIMVLNNEIANYQKQLDTIEVKNMKIVEDIKSEEINTHHKMETLAKLILAIENLYEICKSSGVKIHKENKNLKRDDSKNDKKVNKDNDNIFKYNIEEIMEKIQLIQNTTECMRAVIDMHNAKKENSKPKESNMVKY